MIKKFPFSVSGVIALLKACAVTVRDTDSVLLEPFICKDDNGHHHRVETKLAMAYRVETETGDLRSRGIITAAGAVCPWDGQELSRKSYGGKADHPADKIYRDFRWGPSGRALA